MKINRLSIIILTFFIGCALPSSVVKTTDTRPRISISGAPEKALLYVDGINMGNTSQYDGHPDVLILQPGTHRIQVYSNNEAIYDKKVFIESELKNIVIN